MNIIVEKNCWQSSFSIVRCSRWSTERTERNRIVTQITVLIMEINCWLVSEGAHPSLRSTPNIDPIYMSLHEEWLPFSWPNEYDIGLGQQRRYFASSSASRHKREKWNIPKWESNQFWGWWRQSRRWPMLVPWHWHDPIVWEIERDLSWHLVIATDVHHQMCNGHCPITIIPFILNTITIATAIITTIITITTITTFIIIIIDHHKTVQPPL